MDNCVLEVLEKHVNTVFTLENTHSSNNPLPALVPISFVVPTTPPSPGRWLVARVRNYLKSRKSYLFMHIFVEKSMSSAQK